MSVSSPTQGVPLLAATPITVSPAQSKARPQLVGIDPRYKVIEVIGEGGLGKVYRCFDSKRKMTVALKQMRPAGSNRKTDWTEFINEAKLLQELDHVSIPRVYDVFPERMIKPYFTMELLEGMHLGQVLSRLRCQSERAEELFPLDRLVEQILDVAAAMVAAHVQGVLHRDIKPENIMVLREEPARLVDWGIAVRRDRVNPSGENDASHRDRRQRPRETPGTPLYMSPEQIRNTTDIDCRSDVFSLGVVLFDCLALTTMNRGVTRNEVFRNTLGGDYPSPSEVGLRDEIPESLVSICIKATAFDPEERFQSMLDFHDAIEAVLSDQ